MLISPSRLEQNRHFENISSLSALGISAPAGYSPIAPGDLPASVAARLRQIDRRFPQRPAVRRSEKLQ